MKWAYGVTTVPQRREMLNATLASLAAAGFDSPRLFVDGDGGEYALPHTRRSPKVRAFGNWWLGMLELYIREPHADRYAMFQDDLLAAKGLREYLDKQPYPNGPIDPGYWNLFCLRSNYRLVRDKPRGFYLSNQLGRGALALVFSRTALTMLLASHRFVERPQDPIKGWRSVDGGVVTAMTQAGGKEYVHNPSLVKHVGRVSSFDKRKDSEGLSEDYPEYVWEDGCDGCGFEEVITY